MTAQEALDHARCRLEALKEKVKNGYNFYSMVMEFWKVVVEALEKQVPKKPKKYIAFDGIERNGCPSCKHNEILYTGQRYCSVCGQAIEWS